MVAIHRVFALVVTSVLSKENLLKFFCLMTKRVTTSFKQAIVGSCCRPI